MALTLAAATPARICVLPGLDPGSYRRSPLHASAAIWPEKNCYIDFWIELLHARGDAPEAMLPFVVGIDFDGDQWTFFKPSHDELWALYRIKVQEMTAWRPWVEHAAEHLSAGRLLSVEVDSFWLPDTAGTDYREKHGKTTIVFNDLEITAKRLGYFHNAGYYGLQGEDFDALFYPAAPQAGEVRLPLFAELMSWESAAVAPLSIEAGQHTRVRLSVDLMRRHLERVPRHNPVTRFAQRFADDLPTLQARGLDYYHAWAFAGTRQLGAAFELAACWIEWARPALVKTDADAACADTATKAFRALSSDAKGLILKGARAVALGRPFDVVNQLAPAAQQWASGMQALKTLLA